eukprot:6954566-Pyramimonas_sp.AAC.1
MSGIRIRVCGTLRTTLKCNVRVHKVRVHNVRVHKVRVHKESEKTEHLARPLFELHSVTGPTSVHG